MFVWLTFGQTTSDVIAGLDAAWSFFDGVFPILIPDNLSPVITKAEPTEPRINDTFLEYAQDRGFLIDAARVRHPKDKAWATDCTSWLDVWEDVVVMRFGHRHRWGRTHPAARRRAA